MTEMQALKAKRKSNKATAEDLTRLKVLQDGEPLSAADLQTSKDREEKRQADDKVAFDTRQKVKVPDTQAEKPSVPSDRATLDIPAEHPRIMVLKEALLPFTQIEAHSSRPDEFVLFTRGISITAGDVRKAQKAMRL